MTQSVELLLDNAADTEIRAQWDRLGDAGLPTARRNKPNPSHAPHLTLWAGDLVDADSPGQRHVRAPAAALESGVRTGPTDPHHPLLQVEQGLRRHHLADQHVAAAARPEQQQAADHQLEIQVSEQLGQHLLVRLVDQVTGPQRQVRGVRGARLAPPRGGQSSVTQPVPLGPNLSVRRVIEQQLDRLGQRSRGSTAAATKTRAR